MNANRNTILLVEDDLIEIEMARSACHLFLPTLQLVVVEDSAKALEWLAYSSENNAPLPSLILLDLKLPKLIGLAVLRRLRMNALTLDLPIVVYSQEHEASDVVLSYKVGANSFVSKPSNIEQFSTLLLDLTAYWLQPRQRKQFGAAN